MSNLDELIRTSLDARADGPVDAAAVATEASRRGRRYRRRRRLVLAVTAMSLIGVTSLGVAVVPGIVADYRYDHAAIGAPAGTAVANALPPAAASGALANPTSVGTDPLVVHFDAIGITANARHYEWSSGDGYEQLEAAVGAQLIYLTIGPEKAVLDDAPRQGGPGQVVWSEPVPGLQVRAQAGTVQIAQQAIDAADLTRSQQIILPFAIGEVPAGATATSAYVGFIEGAYVQGGVRLQAPTGESMEIQAQNNPYGGMKTANHSVGGRPAFLYPGEDEIELLVPGLYLSARIGKAYGGFNVAEASQVLASVTVASDHQDLSTWPRPLLP